MLSQKIYRLLLSLYPAKYRGLFASEMSTVFEKTAADFRSRGMLCFARFAVTELLGLLVGSGIEWSASLHNPDEYLSLSAKIDSVLPGEVMESQKQLDLVLNRMVHAISHHDFTGARRYADEEQKAREHLRQLREKYYLDLPPLSTIPEQRIN